MRKFTLIYIITLIILLINPVPALGFNNEPSIDTTKPPEVSAKAFALIDGSGRTLYSKNDDEKLPMASTTKIMTTIVALEKAGLNDIIKVTPKAAKVPGSSIYLKAGEKIKLKDLLYGVMLESGNDAATAVAEGVGGGEENFVKLMNQESLKLGAFNTHFSNPHGLDVKEHYTTASDLAKIALYGLKNKEFAKIVSTKSMVLKSTDEEDNRYFVNHNKMLWHYEGANGVKTGFTDKAGRCLVTSATRNNVTLVCVTLNDSNDWSDTQKLLDYGFNAFEYKNITELVNINARLPVYNSTKHISQIVPANSLYLPVKPDDRITVRYMLPKYLYAPIKKGDIIGYADIIINGEKVSQVNLTVKEHINKN